MSIQFGICQSRGNFVERRDLVKFAERTEHPAPDGTHLVCRNQIAMGFQPFHTHLRSELEDQPLVDEQGNMLTLDGRIDNHRDLCELLEIPDSEVADSKILSAAFMHWGAECFSKLIGDWAVSLWSHTEQALYLARDHAGTRTLYFEHVDDRILWSTSLQTFLDLKNRRELDFEYAACYLTCQPIRDLTPYAGIRAVSPAHYLVISERGRSRKPHWHWMTSDKISYPTDDQYEEHFFSLFRQSVERRTGPGAPILAELSGGMDSTSIVCMSDKVRNQQGDLSNGLLDTISYFDDQEPNWNEQPYFSIVESKRRKSGIHLKISSEDRTFEPPDPQECMALSLPGFTRDALEHERIFENAVGERRYRVILSGMGGDELLGGVPTPLPELTDYLVSCRFRSLIPRAIDFCRSDRTPLIHLLGRTVMCSISIYLGQIGDHVPTPPWVSGGIRKSAVSIHRNTQSQEQRFGFPPSRIENGLTWWRMLETLPHLYPSLSQLEYRYPFLDRDLVDFLHRIPREQLVRPGRRRSLMRRALAGIVPTEILERRRKASLIRGPLLSLERSERNIQRIFEASRLGALGLVDERCLKDALAIICKGTALKWWAAVIKAINLELWLQEQMRGPKDTYAPP